MPLPVKALLHVLYVCLPIAKLASCFACAAFDFDDLARLDGFEVSEASGHERNEVFQKGGFTTENNDRNLPISEVLLGIQIRDQQSGERRTLRPRLRSKADRSQVPRSQHTGRFDIRAGEVAAQSFAHTLVEKDAHSSLGGQQLLSFFQRGDGHLA